MQDDRVLDAAHPLVRLGTAFDEPAWRTEAARGNAEPIPRALALRIVTTGDIERLRREIELVAPHFDRDRDVIAVHVEATVEPCPARLGALFGSLERHFHFAPAGQVARSLGVSAQRVRHGDFAAFAALDIERVDFAADERNLDGALQVLAAAREQGMRHAGIAISLPTATVASDGMRCLRALIEAQPRYLAFRLTDEADDGAHVETLATLAAAMYAGGYRDIGLDPRPLAWLEEDAPRIAGAITAAGKPQLRQEVDQIGLGPGARARIGDAVCENLVDPDDWAAAIDAGRLPLWRGLTLDPEAQLRTDVLAEWLRSGEIDIGAIERRYGIVFEQHFADALARLEPLARDGLASCVPGYVRATSRGRLMLRIMAQCFALPAPQP
jgi:oxygen-independent coproporphyrinogen-3 oxidase